MTCIPIRTGLGGGLLLSAVAALGMEVSPEFLDQTPAADVIILGEFHDNPVHHVNQARAVAAMMPNALVFEMVTPEQALRIDADIRGSRTDLAAVLEWHERGWPDFAMYFPIFEAAPDAAVVGGGLPRETVQRAFAESAAEVFGPDAARYGLHMSLTGPEQADREALQMAAHCDALPGDMMPGMVEAQRLRDAVLARAAVEAVARFGAPVAVIAGSGHADTRRGIPAALSLAAPDLTVVSIGQVEADPGPETSFDFWIITEPAERDDPCAAFR